MSKHNIPKGVRQEFDDVDYWHKLDKIKKVYELKDGTMLTEYEFMKKFMHETYGNNFSRTEPDSNIIQTDEMKRWARRNNNNTNRDTLNVIKKSNTWIDVFQIQDRLYKKQDVESWENTFKTSSYENSFRELAKFSADELDIELTSKKLFAIIRVYFRIKKFLRLVRADRKVKKGKSDE